MLLTLSVIVGTGRSGQTVDPDQTPQNVTKPNRNCWDRLVRVNCSHRSDHRMGVNLTVTFGSGRSGQLVDPDQTP